MPVKVLNLEVLNQQAVAFQDLPCGDVEVVMTKRPTLMDNGHRRTKMEDNLIFTIPANRRNLIAAYLRDEPYDND